MYLKTSAQAPRLDAGPCSWRRATPGIATLVFARPRMRAQPQHRGPCKAGLCPGSVAILVPRAAAGRKRGAFLPGCGQHLGSQSLSSHGQRSGAVVFLAVAESKELALCYPGWQSATSFLCRRVNRQLLAPQRRALLWWGVQGSQILASARREADAPAPPPHKHARRCLCGAPHVLETPGDRRLGVTLLEED